MRKKYSDLKFEEPVAMAFRDLAKKERMNYSALAKKLIKNFEENGDFDFTW